MYFAITHVILVDMYNHLAPQARQPHLTHWALLLLMLLSTVIRPHSMCRGFGMVHTFLPGHVPVRGQILCISSLVFATQSSCRALL